MNGPRILLVRFSAIGDCVMAAWAATALRERWPEGFLCWAVEGRCAPMVDRYRLVTQRLEFPRDRWKAARWSPRTWQEQVAKYARLRRLRFDLGYDLQGHSKTALALRLAKPRRRVAAHATDALAGRLNPVLGAAPEGVHTVEWNHRVLESLEPVPFASKPILPDVGSEPDARLVTLSVSAGQPEKAYPLALWEEVAVQLVARGDRVVWLGGRSDPHPREGLGQDQVGKLRLKETLRLVGDSAVHLAADTGTGHMAAALGTPVVSVFGPTDPARYRPYAQRGAVLRNGEETEAVTPDEILTAAGGVRRG